MALLYTGKPYMSSLFQKFFSRAFFAMYLCGLHYSMLKVLYDGQGQMRRLDYARAQPDFADGKF
nr:MAG TPA: hypothetical protein [Caudoviricetes sp.]